MVTSMVERSHVGGRGRVHVLERMTVHSECGPLIVVLGKPGHVVTTYRCTAATERAQGAESEKKFDILPGKPRTV